MELTAEELAKLAEALTKLMELYNDPRWVNDQPWIHTVIVVVQGAITSTKAVVTTP